MTQQRIGGELEGVIGADGGGLLARRFEVDHRSIGGDDVGDRVDLDTCDRAAQGNLDGCRRDLRGHLVEPEVEHGVGGGFQGAGVDLL